MPKTYELDLGDYWRIIVRRRAIVIGTFILITGAVYWHASRLPPIYEASASIKIERQRPLQENQVDWDVDFIETQMEVINSTGVAREAAITAGLIKDGMSQEEIEGAAAQFYGVSLTRKGQTNIVELSVTSSDPKQAALVVNMVAKGYQKWSLREHNEEALQVRVFIGNQLKENEEALNEKEEELRVFKEKSPIGANIAAFQAQLVDMELKLSDLLEQYTYRHPEVAELQAQIDTLKSKLGSYPEIELQYNRLTREIDNLKSINTTLKQKYEDSRTAEAQNVSGVTILTEALVPDLPIAPDVTKNVTLGGIVALILGVLLAFVKENIDTSISTIEEVEDFLQVPILGVIPEIVIDAESSAPRGWGIKKFFDTFFMVFFKGSSEKEVSSTDIMRKYILLGGQEHPFSSFEAYKTFRTNVLFAVGEKKGQVIEITSSGAREGKSLTSLNLSLSLAQAGNKTCLISGDLRRESICRIMGVGKEPGLVDILTRGAPWQDVIRKTTDFLIGDIPADQILQTLGIDNFYLLAPGKLPLNPAELLSLEAMDVLLKDLRSNFDFVIVDTPPVLPISDPSILAPKTDGVILIYQVGRTARGALKRTKVQLTNTGTRILGVVLNNIKASEMRMAPTYYYYYKDYYGPEGEATHERHKRKRSWWRCLFHLSHSSHMPKIGSEPQK